MTNDFFEISTPYLLPEKPVLSVLMITYNHEKYLGQAIEGAVSQIVDFPIELIIGEDCSSDKTRDVALEYQKKYPNLIRVIYSDKNVGSNRNFSRVLSLCRGEYVAICDGDDIWVDKEKLTKQVMFLSKNPEYVVTYHDYRIFNNTGSFDSFSNTVTTGFRDCSSDELVMGTSMLQPLTICFRNVIHDLPEEFYKVLGGDVFLRSLLGSFGKGKYLDNIEPAVYRIHQGGIWQGLKIEEQLINYVTTRYWLSVYHKRMGNDVIAAKFVLICIDQFFSIVTMRLLLFLKWAIRKAFYLSRSNLKLTLNRLKQAMIF